MKKNRIIQIATGALLLLTTIAGGATLAWLHPTTKVGNQGETNTLPIDGSSSSGYFAYGDGSSDHPYGIRIPRHLYNLAWLQYLGAFQNRQLYFELAGNVDMKGWTLPPIGTEDNPFVSQFNGQGYVVSNLTVSNNFGDYNVHPATITAFNTTTNKQPHIVGMFGVVGNYNNLPADSYDSSINTLTDTGIYNATIKTVLPDSLIGIAAGYNSADLSNIVVDASSTNIEASNSTYYAVPNATNPYTKNISDYTLVGYTTKTASIRHDDETIYDINTVAGKEFNAVEQSDDQGWGGSINMKTIYYRLASLRRTKSTDVSNSFQFRQEHYYYDGVERTTEAVNHTGVSSSPRTNGGYSNSRDAYSRYNGYNESGHEYIGSYNIYARAVDYGYPAWYTTLTTDQAYMYLSGGHYENRTYRTLNSHTGYPITDGNGHYLTANVTSGNNNSNNAGSITNSEVDSASLWSVPTTGTGYISTNYRYNGGTDRTYYLYVTDDHTIRLSTSTSYRTQFTYAKDSSTGKIRYLTSDNRYLTYANGVWSLALLSQDPSSFLNNGYQIYYNGHYLSRASNTTTGFASELSVENTYGWRFENTSNNNDVTIDSASSVRIYTMLSGNNTTKYYVTDNGDQDSYWRVGLTTTRNSATTFTVTRASNGVYRFNESSNLYLVCDYSNNVFSVRTARNNNNNRQRDLNVSLTSSLLPAYDPSASYALSETSSRTSTGPDYYQTSNDSTKSTNESRMYYTAEDTTYFPLNVEKDIDTYISNASTMNTRISSGDLDPKDSNTGYIVSGSYIGNNQTTLSSASSRIRISEYTIDNVGNSYSVSAGSTTTIADLSDSDVLTIDTSGSQTNMGALDTTSTTTMYPRYLDSKESFFKNSLTTSTTNNGTTTYSANTNVYGLHFMDSLISKESVVNGSKVYVLGNKCDNYQLPVNSVDFNLKQKGVVNFFAGSYYSGNKAFFSLHEVLRNDDAVQKTNGDSEPITGQYTSYNTIKDIKEIEEIWSTDQGTKTSKYANIYKYKGKTGAEMYSVPYRVDGQQQKYKMEKNSTTDSSTLYEYATMNATDFNSYCNTYGYTLRFKTSQIGAHSSLTSDSIYYFEFPMNPGEYCLGSVQDADGAYLLYLDIGANASKTQRTIFYEHFVVTENILTHPVGVALQDLSSSGEFEPGVVAISSTIDDSDSACMVIKPTASGTSSMDRSENSVAITRAQYQNAPPVYPNYAGNSVTITENGSALESQGLIVIHDITRMKYYDYNVNMENLTVTTITDTKTTAYDGTESTVRAIKQEIYNSSSQTGTPETYVYDSSIDQRDSMKVYNTDTGTRYTSADLLTIQNTVSSTLTTAVLKIQIDLSGLNDAYDNDLIFYADIGTYESYSGTYYAFDHYTIEIVVSSGQVVVKVVDFKSGDSYVADTIYIGSTLVTLNPYPDPITIVPVSTQP